MQKHTKLQYEISTASKEVLIKHYCNNVLNLMLVRISGSNHPATGSSAV